MPKTFYLETLTYVLDLEFKKSMKKVNIQQANERRI